MVNSADIDNRDSTSASRSPRILIIEDDEGLAFGLEINLAHEGFDICICNSGAEAIKRVKQDPPDAILLDLMLPDVDGFGVLRALSSLGFPGPIIVLSGRSEESDRVASFRLGADDFVAKPFGVLELIERIHLRLSSHRIHHENTRGIIQIDKDQQIVRVCGAPIHLTPKEFDLLLTLVNAHGNILSKRDLLRMVWGTEANVDTRTVEVHIGRLRSKLIPYHLSAWIRTVHSRGFAWLDPSIDSFA